METSVFVGTSLDGFIARGDGSLDWLQSESTQPQEYGFTAFFDSVDAVLIGRKTYDVVLGFEKWFYGSKPVFVLSRTLRKLDLPEGAVCELVAGTPRCTTGWSGAASSTCTWTEVSPSRPSWRPG